MTAAIAALRAQIDALDDALIALLGERLAVARALGAEKPVLGRDAAREAAIVARLVARDPGLADVVPGVWELLFQASDRWQRHDRDPG